MYETTNVPDPEAVIVKAPLKSVETPLEVPLTSTVAPGNGDPNSESTTVPETVF